LKFYKVIVIPRVVSVKFVCLMKLYYIYIPTTSRLFT